MSLFKMYCKEIIRELNKIPVYLPGRQVKVGDIIYFKDTLFGPKPIGSFEKKSDLDKLKVKFEVVQDPDPDSYLFASRGSVGAVFTSDGDVGNQAKGKLEISFSKEGATYFAAIDTQTSYIDNLAEVEKALEPHWNDLDWDKLYIVVSVTVAKKALIMQSNSTSAGLNITGEVKGLNPGGDATDVNANISLSVKMHKDSAFIKDWSDNVQVFFGLVRFKNANLRGWDTSSKSFGKRIEEADFYRLEQVNPQEGLIDDES